MGQALLQILIADLTMSLDNVLAVAGAAREHPQVLIAGLLLSITLMGVAASWIAKLLHRFRWLGYVGLVIVLGVAGRMMWEGHRTVVVDMHRVGQYNAVMPAALDITPAEAAAHKAAKK
jgi:predicted tellurium resistance membrane protein TerC